MRRLVSVFALIVIAITCFCGCDSVDVEGRWVCDSDPSYYFELYDNGVCYMFDEAGEWVSEGTYEAGKTYIAFEMDTGFFIWSKQEDGMMFESSDTVKMYYRTEE